MTKPSFPRTSVLFLAPLFLACLAFAALPALAQHGGGGHGGGGGHASGGAAHAGGGGFSGGGVRSAGAAAPRGGPGGGSFYRQPPATAGRYVNPNYANPGGGTYARGAQAPNAYRSEPGTVSGAANAERDGQWHSFGNASGNENGSTAAVGNAAGNSGQANGGWESFAGPTRGGATAGVRPAGDAGIRSFAGEGHNVVETTPARPAAPNFAAARLGFAGPGVTSARLGGSPALFGGTALPRSNFAFNSGFGFRTGGFGFNRFGFGRFGFNRFGFGFRYPFYGIGWPFWGFGAGFYNTCPYGPGWYDGGYGFGYGADPFWYNAAPCAGLWGAGYGPWDVNPYPSPGPYVYPYDYPDEQGPPPPDQNNPQDQQYQQYQPQDQPLYQNAPPPGEVYNAPPNNGPDINEPTEAQRNAMKPVQLYLKSGGVFEATIYWIANNRLNYVTDNGAVITVDIDQLDLQRTISENAKRGVPFTLSVQGDSVPPPVESAPANTPQSQ